MAKVNLKTRWWKPIDDNNYYYLSHKGFLIVKKRYEYIQPKIDKKTNRVFYQLYKNQKVYLEELYKQIFNKEKKFDLKWYKKALSFWKREREKTLKQRIKKRLERKKKELSTYSRRCHDCGRPTNNYRCDECWKKIRGEDAINNMVETYNCYAFKDMFHDSAL